MNESYDSNNDYFGSSNYGGQDGESYFSKLAFFDSPKK
jgi:hypothetical protein